MGYTANERSNDASEPEKKIEQEIVEPPTRKWAKNKKRPGKQQQIRSWEKVMINARRHWD